MNFKVTPGNMPFVNNPIVRDLDLNTAGDLFAPAPGTSGAAGPNLLIPALVVGGGLLLFVLLSKKRH